MTIIHGLEKRSGPRTALYKQGRKHEAQIVAEIMRPQQQQARSTENTSFLLLLLLPHFAKKGANRLPTQAFGVERFQKLTMQVVERKDAAMTGGSASQKKLSDQRLEVGHHLLSGTGPRSYLATWRAPRPWRKSPIR